MLKISASIENAIVEEYLELAEEIKKKTENGIDIQTHQLFNLSITNILWKMISGKRYDLKDSDQKKRLDMIEEILKIVILL